MLSLPVILAQNAGALTTMLFPILIIGVMFYFLLWRPESRRQQAHKSLLDGLKKDDRVVTIGGIYGVVANVRRDVDRVTLKIDEANNTRIDVTFGAINRVVTDEPSSEK